jgi:four helix bundle protein
MVRGARGSKFKSSKFKVQRFKVQRFKASISSKVQSSRGWPLLNLYPINRLKHGFSVRKNEFRFMATFNRFEEIKSWQKARELNKFLSAIIVKGNFGHHFRLVSQVEGAAGSIMDNIAEGFERGGNKEFLQFLFIAKGSCGEFRSQLYRAIDMNLLSEEEFNCLFAMALEISGLIQKLVNYLKTSVLRGHKYRKESIVEH